MVTAVASDVILMEPGGEWPCQMDRVSCGYRRRPDRGDGLGWRRKFAECTEVLRALGYACLGGRWAGCGPDQ